MNIIVLMNDTFRRDHIGAYGNDWIHTPNLDGFAEQSAVFDRFYIASYPTIPNRWDIATGRFGFPIRGWEPLSPGDVTVAQLLSQAGYTTHLIYDPPQIGYHNFDYTRGFDAWWWVRGQHADPYMTDPEIPQDIGAQYHKCKTVSAMRLYRRNQGVQRYDRDHKVARIAGAACDWLETNHSLDRFALFVDMWDPHEPFDPPWYDLARYADPDFDGDQIIYPPYGRSGYMSPDEAQHVRALYAGQVTTVDRWVGRILETVERLRLDSTTLVMFMTDHGHLFGEHDLEGKPGGQLGNLYEETTRIPLMVRHPEGLGAGTRVPGFAQPVDILPTLMEIAGGPRQDPEAEGMAEANVVPVDGEGGGEVAGQSLWPLISGDKSSIRDHVVSGRFPAVVEGKERQPGVGHLFDGWVGSDRVVEALTVTETDWAMICNPKGRPSELYDLENDPHQLDNVIDLHPDRAAAMYRRAVEALEQGGALPARLRPFTEGVAQAATDLAQELWSFADDGGKEIAFTSEGQALAVGRDAEGNPNRRVTHTTFGELLSRDPKALIYVHGQYYWASDLA